MTVLMPPRLLTLDFLVLFSVMEVCQKLEATSTLFPDHVLHYDGFTYLLAQGG